MANTPRRNKQLKRARKYAEENTRRKSRSYEAIKKRRYRRKVKWEDHINQFSKLADELLVEKSRKPRTQEERKLIFLYLLALLR